MTNGIDGLSFFGIIPIRPAELPAFRKAPDHGQLDQKRALGLCVAMWAALWQQRFTLQQGTSVTVRVDGYGEPERGFAVSCYEGRGWTVEPVSDGLRFSAANQDSSTEAKQPKAGFCPPTPAQFKVLSPTSLEFIACSLSLEVWRRLLTANPLQAQVPLPHSCPEAVNKVIAVYQKAGWKARMVTDGFQVYENEFQVPEKATTTGTAQPANQGATAGQRCRKLRSTRRGRMVPQGCGGEYVFVTTRQRQRMS